MPFFFQSSSSCLAHLKLPSACSYWSTACPHFFSLKSSLPASFSVVAPGSRSAGGSRRSSSAGPCIHMLFWKNVGHVSKRLRSCSIWWPLIFIAVCIMLPNSVLGSIMLGSIAIAAAAAAAALRTRRPGPRFRPTVGSDGGRASGRPGPWDASAALRKT
eukprot:scaffold10031_cov62-Phaeocystis_antarctica.AAC.3